MVTPLIQVIAKIWHDVFLLLSRSVQFKPSGLGGLLCLLGAIAKLLRSLYQKLALGSI
ncbi:MAG TPA: hypothetical protein V6D35_23495 [Candidatus Sericytochromatia bacterium]